MRHIVNQSYEGNGKYSHILKPPQVSPSTTSRARTTLQIDKYDGNEEGEGLTAMGKYNINKLACRLK